jgi:hydrogenase maturation protein HypF
VSWLKIDLPFKIKKPILAVGADVKSNICLSYNKSALISEVIGDLEILDNFNKFRKRISSITQSTGLKPKVISYDKHPEYLSTKYVLNLPKKYKNLKLIPVQHHHAHIASCMAENGLMNQKVIGVAFDGTGFGGDDTLWGAEFLISDYQGYKRAAHLRYIPLLGGMRAITEPWRTACAWLYLAFGEHFLDLRFLKWINKQDWGILQKMWKQNFNSPPASSIGRLFDAAASLILKIRRVRFEAEAAINLERLACEYKFKPSSYKFEIKRDDNLYVIDPVPTFKGITYDLKTGHNKQEVAARFHMTVAQMVRKTCIKIRDNTRVNAVVLTGGVFQNKFLSMLSMNLLRKIGFNVLTHKILLPSDVSISLGQAAIAKFAN